MAIYHASAKIISRSGGKSILAAAAYRAGDLLTDQRLGKSFDYTKKQGVDSTIILAPSNAPDWVYNREKLWNQVEAAENRKDSQLAREFNIALPVELNKEQMKDLAKSYVQEQFVNRGMVADVAFHDLYSDNPHFHVLLTMRDITEQGFSSKKNRDWNSTELLVEQREAWATHVNAALEKIGLVEEKIDHRTLVAQGITDRIAQVHLGPELHRIRQEYIEARDLEGFRDRYQIGDLYESINEINRELASSHTALEELDELIALSQEAMEEIKEQTTSFPSAKNRTMNPNEPNEESDREREWESTAESLNLTERLNELTDYFTSSSREALYSGRKLQSLAERLRGGRGKVGESREPSQSIGESLAAFLEPTKEESRRPQKPNQGVEKGTGAGTSNSFYRVPEQSENLQQKLSSHLGSGTEGQGKFERTTEQARSSDVASPGGSNSNPDQSSQLGLSQDLSPERQSNRTNQGTGEQHRDQAQSTGESEKSLSSPQRQSDLNNLAAISTIIRLMQDLDEETFEGQRYRLKVSPDFLTVQMYANDGRGLILEQKDGQIRGQLLDEDLKAIKNLNQQLDRREGQRQVNRCMPVLFKHLQRLGQYTEETATRLISYDRSTQILTYHNQQNPQEFLVAQWTQQGWEYLEGHLTPSKEKAISVDLANFLSQREQEQKKERAKGFER